MTVRDEAHRLIDAVPEPGDVPRRRFRTTAIFDGEPDLGTRAKTIVRDAWTGSEASST